MRSSRELGLTTIECLVALVIFALSALGAAGTIALSMRAERAGQRAAEASWMAGTVFDSLRSQVLAGAGECSRITGGGDRGPHGITASWLVSGTPGGREILLTLSFQSLTITSLQSAWTFIPCR